MAKEIYTPQVEREINKEENKKIINIHGWKGKDKIEINKVLGGYMIREHRKDKETEEIVTQEHSVLEEDYEFLLGIINQIDLNYKVGYRYIVKRILDKLGVKMDINAFNGGQNRAKFYFKYYYYPLKIMEWQRKIIYFGKGGIMRLK